MKMIITVLLAIVLTVVAATTAFARPFDYSEETKRLMREAGMDPETPEWEEINRRQIERRNRINSKKKTAIAGTCKKTVSGQNRGYGSKNSYDEFHTVPKGIPPNDNYYSGSFDELHINENYSRDVWHPEDRGMRINGFDEFHFPDEM